MEGKKRKRYRKQEISKCFVKLHVRFTKCFFDTGNDSLFKHKNDIMKSLYDLKK